MVWKALFFSSYAAGALSAAAGKRQASSTTASSSSGVPQYLQTSPELFPGPTPTGAAPFLAATNPAPFAGVSYIPNGPLETQVPIAGNVNNSNIFERFGQLSPYFANPIGWGVDEYALPKGSNISWWNLLHRHGARYPTDGAGAQVLGGKLQNLSSSANFTGDLAFLSEYKYNMGSNILVPVGKQQLFDSGTLHYYQYGHLYNNNGSKIVVRSTTQDRMTQSAEYFLAGFFGLTWTENATLVLGMEVNNADYNNTLNGWSGCPNAGTTAVGQVGTNATSDWYDIYLVDAVKRLNSMTEGYSWTLTDAYNAQSLCAYETVAFGYSAFCSLFTYEEWLGYEYSVDLYFGGTNGFQSPTGRAVGVGYVQEVLARLQHRLITVPTAQCNTTLDSMEETFPTNSVINLDFSHDSNIMSILTAFGFTQFAPTLPTDHMVPHDLISSHVCPFAARLDIEIIDTPYPVKANRSECYAYENGSPQRYIHFIMNQRTLPLHTSFAACPYRDDGWCELETFITVLEGTLAEAQFDYSCFGNYTVTPYGTVTNGVPVD